MKRISNQSDEFAKYHLDVNNTKKNYEDAFDFKIFNEMSVEDQLELMIRMFPLGSKVYTNLNCKPIECEVLGYTIKTNSPDSRICNLLTNKNEIEQGYTWDKHGNTSAHPGWFYAVESMSKEHLETTTDIENYKDVITTIDQYTVESNNKKKSLLTRILTKIKF